MANKAKREEKLIMGIVHSCQALGWEVCIPMNQGEEDISAIIIGKTAKVSKISDNLPRDMSWKIFAPKKGPKVN